MDMKRLMEEAGEMQKAFAKKQEEFASKTFEASSGGGMVTAIVNGKYELINLTIDPSIVSGEDIGMLQDLVIAAVNGGFKKAQGAMQEEMSGMFGGLGKMQSMFG